MTDPRPSLRALEARYGQRGRVFLLHLDLTWRCPLDCPHCFLGDRLSDELGTEAWLELLDQARDQQVVEIVLSGGDPMVRKDFTLLLEAARDRGFVVLVKTTGLHLGPADADRFARLGWVLADVSLHSLDPAVHDAFVGRAGAWRKAVDAIEALRGRGVPVRITRNLLDGIPDDGGALRAWARDRGLAIAESTALIRRRDGAAAGRAPLEGDARLQAVQRLMALRPSVTPRPAAPSAPHCSAGHTRLYVTPAGEVTPCVAWARPLGHVRDGGLSRVLASDGLANVRALRVGDRAGCDGCALRPTCSFCPGQAEVLTGLAHAPYPPACEQARVLASALRRLRPPDGGPS